MALVVAIDGPAAAGKGTLARRLAAAFDLPYLDTGLLYRGVGRKLLRAGQDPSDPAAAAQAAALLQPEDLARPDLRGSEADSAASQVAANPAVRAALLTFQRGFARQGGVLDGRDIGTVIFPDAALKLFVTASIAARAERRWRELQGRGVTAVLAEVQAELAARDTLDASRAASPLRPAEDAITIDTTGLSADQVFERARALVGKARGSAPLL